MQSLGGHDTRFDQGVDWFQGGCAGANLIGKSGRAEIDTFAGMAFSLPVQWLVLPELLEQDHGQQVRPGPSARAGVEGVPVAGGSRYDLRGI